MFNFLKKPVEKDLTELTNEQGKKWEQPSTDNLFLMQEFNDIFSTKDTGEIALAQIDFQTVNKEYYETAIELQKKLKQQHNLIQHLSEESKKMIDRKNKKLKELIDYINSLHAYIVELGKDPDLINKIANSTENVNTDHV